VNVRRTARALLVTVVTGSAPLVVPSVAMTQDNSPQAADSGSPNGYYAPENYYAHSGYPRWTIQYGPFHSTPGWSYYRPLQPGDWGCGPCGPRHNLNSSQKSPSGMTWW
jgi:hypothetical protein